MAKRLLLTSLFSCLLYLTGCSFTPLRYMAVNSTFETYYTKHPLIDPNTGPLKMTVEGKRIKSFNTKPIIELSEPCRIKLASDSHIVVTGQAPKGSKCRVSIDSGFPGFCMLSDNIVRENSLHIYPTEGGQVEGVCYLPSLQLGKATICDVPCYYTKKLRELQLFGIPINRLKKVWVGIRLMRDFKYIVLDNSQGEIELSAKQSFIPVHPNCWIQYPFKIEKDINGELRLMVKIPIAGENLWILFDTCSSPGLSVDAEFWAKLSERAKTVKIKDSKNQYYQTGLVDCQRAIVSELTIGHRIIANAEVVFFPEDKPHEIQIGNKSYKFPNVLGMGYFKDTVIALDFEHGLLWVRKE